MLRGSSGFFTTFSGINCTFLPLHFIGLQGGPRRYTDLPDFYKAWAGVSTYGSLVGFMGVISFLNNMVLRTLRGRCMIAHPGLSGTFE
jgi:cytochrome c oxidase subunit 1